MCIHRNLSGNPALDGHDAEVNARITQIHELNCFVSVTGWIIYVNSLKMTLRNILVILALFDV